MNVKKVAALGLIAPVFFEHRPHLDLAHVHTEPQPSSPFVLMSTLSGTAPSLSAYAVDAQAHVPK
jgi:hypothetical protein